MKRPSVEISVHNLNSSESGSSFYKTDDVIQGEVLFAPHHATRLENINITFQGILRAVPPIYKRQ